MVFVNLLSQRIKNSNTIKRKKWMPAVVATMFALMAGSCTTSNSTNKSSEGVISAESARGADQPDLQDVPEELRNAHRFDPALTLDPKVVQESDFYQIKQSIERNRAALEAAWKEQEAVEARVKAALSAEKQRKAELAKKEEEERDLKRRQAAEEFEKTKDIRAKYEVEAEKRVKKMPTISRDDELWNGLED